jgi:hypothetical protein
VHLAYEFRLAPSVVANESPRMIATMQRYLRWRGIEAKKAMTKKGAG